MAYSPLVVALVEQGRLDEADDALAAANLDGEIPDSFMLNFVLFARGRLRRARADHDKAAADLEELATRERKWRARNPAAFPWRTELALVRADQGDAARALALSAEELELARHVGTAGAIGRALRVLGLLRGGDDGLGLLRESLDVLAGGGWRLEHARTLVELGAAIRRAGRRTDAREPLHSGMELAHRCAASPLVERAREELVAAGARPRRIMRTGVDALTASERRVALMAADGMTNREIAQALFVTLRTVEVHLTHAYHKLDIASREQLPGVLRA
jgi:DNA-binding CsgD family transcriptional regulator